MLPLIIFHLKSQQDKKKLAYKWIFNFSVWII